MASTLVRNQMSTCPRIIKLICAIIICSCIGRVSSDSHLSNKAKIAFWTIGRPFPWLLASHWQYLQTLGSSRSGHSGDAISGTTPLHFQTDHNVVSSLDCWAQNRHCQQLKEADRNINPLAPKGCGCQHDFNWAMHFVNFLSNHAHFNDQRPHWRSFVRVIA